uniref:Secreted protein n=2 Tax=Parascaris univalens TaxID=6257 RepID=A0A915AMA1_PARUN
PVKWSCRYRVYRKMLQLIFLTALLSNAYAKQLQVICIAHFHHTSLSKSEKSAQKRDIVRVETCCFLCHLRARGMAPLSSFTHYKIYFFYCMNLVRLIELCVHLRDRIYNWHCGYHNETSTFGFNSSLISGRLLGKYYWGGYEWNNCLKFWNYSIIASNFLNI